jgi:hypothetical protein
MWKGQSKKVAGDTVVLENELDKKELDYINAQQVSEVQNPNLLTLDGPRGEAYLNDLRQKKAFYETKIAEVEAKSPHVNIPLNMFEKTEINNLSRLNGKARKAIVAAIGTYNVTQRRMDNLNLFLDRGGENKESTYPCATMTCKKRGKNIKKALFDIAQFSEEALGNIGVAAVAKSTKNYLFGWNDKGRTRPQEQGPDFPVVPGSSGAPASAPASVDDLQQRLNALRGIPAPSGPPKAPLISSSGAILPQIQRQRQTGIRPAPAPAPAPAPSKGFFSGLFSGGKTRKRKYRKRKSIKTRI